MIPSDLWWNYVPAGVSIRDGIGQQIMAGRCILLNTSHLPWKEELMKSVHDQVVSNDAELNWNVIDAEEIVGYKPIGYLGSFFGVDQVPVERMIQQRIRQIRSCCWVRNIPERESQLWVELAKDLFGGKDQSSFRLVLELPSITVRGIGRIAIIDAKIERFDIYYFALSFLAAGRLCKSYQEYASTLCAELAHGDVEFCYALCRNIKGVLEEPLAACFANGNELQQKQLVCRAQMRSISPLIDIGRLKLISIFEKRIKGILPQTDDYGNVLDNVNEVELRHLVYFSSNSLLPIAPKEKEMLYCLYNARNAISHLDILSYDEIQELFRTLEELSA